MPELRWNLISLSQLDSAGFGYSCHGGVIKVYQGSTMIMKGSRSSGLYTLKQSGLGGAKDGSK